MCKQGNTIKMELHHVGEIRLGIANIDSCIASIIKALNKGNVYTDGCCCGHGEISGYIHLTDGRYLGIYPNKAAFKEVQVRRPKYFVQDKLITIALAQVNGHRIKAAKLLGMPVRTLQRRIKKRKEKDIK